MILQYKKRLSQTVFASANQKHSQIWEVTRHQYRISVPVSQTSVRVETSGGVLKSWLFSQARYTLNKDFPAILITYDLKDFARGHVKIASVRSSMWS